MKNEDLIKLQKIQLKYIGFLDIQIATRADQQTTMFTVTNYPVSRKLYHNKLKWDIDNTKEFEKINEEINKLLQ